MKQIVRWDYAGCYLGARSSSARCDFIETRIELLPRAGQTLSTSAREEEACRALMTSYCDSITQRCDTAVPSRIKVAAKIASGALNGHAVITF